MDVMSLRQAALPPVPAANEEPDSVAEVRREEAIAWQLLGIVTVFWIYVALSNVLFVRTLSAGIDPAGTANYFASWEPRVLQHVFLYPLLVACLWKSVRVGWSPLWRAIPIQLLLSITFAVSATPLLAIAENMMSPVGWRVPQDLAEILGALFSGTRQVLWIAGTTNFELTYGFALTLVTSFTFYRRFRDSELRLAALERAWSEARLSALRGQLSPHTLFNLLHTIRGQIAWDPAAAQSMIVRLGDLLRALLVAGEREFSSLREEVLYERLYLELQQQRFEGQIKVSLPQLEALPSVWVPALILQPLVENAIVHGLCGHDCNVTIEMDVAIDDTALMLRLTNSVPAQRTAVARSGIGLRNVRERLALHFGDRSRFSAGLDGPRQWKVEMRLPLLPLESGRPSTEGSRE